MALVIVLLSNLAEWCNGNIKGSAPFAVGSIPTSATINFFQKGDKLQSTSTNVLSVILDVFDAVGEWISDAVQAFIPMFYDTSTGLTFLGVLAVAGLAFSVVFLLIGIIQKFLKFGA